MFSIFFFIWLVSSGSIIWLVGLLEIYSCACLEWLVDVPVCWKFCVLLQACTPASWLLLSFLLYHSVTGAFCVYGLSIWFDFGADTLTFLKGAATCYHAKPQQTECRMTWFFFLLLCVSTETCWTETPSLNQTQVRSATFFFFFFY